MRENRNQSFLGYSKLDAVYEVFTIFSAWKINSVFLNFSVPLYLAIVDFPFNCSQIFDSRLLFHEGKPVFSALFDSFILNFNESSFCVIDIPPNSARAQDVLGSNIALSTKGPSPNLLPNHRLSIHFHIDDNVIQNIMIEASIIIIVVIDSSLLIVHCTDTDHQKDCQNNFFHKCIIQFILTILHLNLSSHAQHPNLT